MALLLKSPIPLTAATTTAVGKSKVITGGGLLPKQFAPLVVALVGLPGRGKSVLARRLARHLNYIGERVTVVDVSEFRRRQTKGHYSSHEMFRADNAPAKELRIRSWRYALDEAAQFIVQPGNSIAIIDGPNVSRAQRQEIYDRFNGELGCRVMFVECVCEDPTILERHFKDILVHSADYRDMVTEQALHDLTLKMAHYGAQLEPPALGSPDEPPCPTVKLLDGGHGGVVAHGVCGIREARILAYVTSPRPIHQTIYFSRHGESEYNVTGRIGGDSSLSPKGRRYAAALARHVNTLGLPGLQVWTSKLLRTIQTASGIVAPKLHLAELNEIESGECEGLTEDELRNEFPHEMKRRDKDKLRYRYPCGESYEDVMRRVTPVLAQLETEHNVLIVAHQAVLRCLLAYFLEIPLDSLPHQDIPTHTLMRVTLRGHTYTMETVQIDLDGGDDGGIRKSD